MSPLRPDFWERFFRLFAVVTCLATFGVEAAGCSGFQPPLRG